jgi:hypothetical protein
MITSSPKKFAEWFNGKYIGTYYKITSEDIKDMTTCGLIHRYEYYSGSIDGETVRGVLQFEKLRESRTIQKAIEKILPTCKICGQPIPPQLSVKPGRPREYCPQCQPRRARERYKKWTFRKSHHKTGINTETQ